MRESSWSRGRKERKDEEEKWSGKVFMISKGRKERRGKAQDKQRIRKECE